MECDTCTNRKYCSENFSYLSWAKAAIVIRAPKILNFKFSQLKTQPRTKPNCHTQVGTRPHLERGDILHSIIYIFTPEEWTYTIERQQRDYRVPIITYAYVLPARTEADPFGGSNKPIETFVFYNVVVAWERVAETFQTGNASIIYNNKRYMIEGSRVARNNTFTLSGVLDSDYDPNKFVFFTLNDERATIGDDNIGFNRKGGL